jgi:hypothetical protein
MCTYRHFYRNVFLKSSTTVYFRFRRRVPILLQWNVRLGGGRRNNTYIIRKNIDTCIQCIPIYAYTYYQCYHIYIYTFIYLLDISIIIYDLCFFFLRNYTTRARTHRSAECCCRCCRPREMWCKVNGSTALYKYNGVHTHVYTRQVRGYTH